ncbi:probable ATP-dependent RNA helicase DDX31 isoform X2 [Anneissia japonica]|uniref:probable ATP-dependent RNA helicase DDX31 isoform X2 n=1 Tax=Anneissia japonica TaxID=1529436 RepID=UPI0014259A8E|nr:probable ATP-dependent RNA helicase DDX31 isoform X2 [Anneissia japonica]
MMADEFAGITLNLSTEYKTKKTNSSCTGKKRQKIPLKSPPGKSAKAIPAWKHHKTSEKLSPDSSTKAFANVKGQKTSEKLATGRSEKIVPIVEKRKVSVKKFKGKNEIWNSPVSKIQDSKHDTSSYKGVVSSLFKNNPKIPVIERNTVQQHNEGLFSDSNFKNLNLHPFMISNLEERLKLSQVTQVQNESIPAILSGQDVLIKSQTGTGKTLAYAVPIVQSLQAMQPPVARSHGVHALVLVPTRELALQSFETFRKLVYPFQWIVPGSIMGGEKKKAEKARIRKGINILIATPGRMVDHVQNTRSLDLSGLKWFVLDEADRLLDMGFEKDIATITNSVNEQSSSRQNVLLSATLTEGVERLAGISLHDPLYINIAKDQEKVGSGPASFKEPTKGTDKYYTTPNQLKQHFLVVPSKLRLVTLATFLLWRCKISEKSKVVVFLSSRDAVEFHSVLLSRILNKEEDEDDKVHELLRGTREEQDDDQKINFYKLHGNMTQEERTSIYQEFCLVQSGVLLCTDVAARGLDLPKVKWIVQYNTPETPEVYIHRVGRTARIGKEGQSILFLTPAEVDYVGILSQQKISLKEMAVNDVLNTLLTYDLFNSNRKRAHHTWEEAASALQLHMENFVLKKHDNQQLAKTACQSFIRAYATYPSHLKHIFHVKNLHLGHVAKSFGLRVTPTSIGSNIQKLRHKQAIELKRKNVERY